MRGGYDDPAMGTREGNGDFGGELRGYRESAGLSQEELAERAGLTAKGISALERGERQRPYPQTVRALAEALNLSDAERSALIAAIPRRGQGDVRVDTTRPLLATKWYVPRPRNGAIERPRLLERLHGGLDSKLTLISAPAGFGKTSLLARWLTEVDPQARSRAWVSLDAGDSDPTTFWSYVVAALQAAAPGIGATSRGYLADVQPPPIQSILATLVNELGSTATPMILILDDYHLVDAQEVHVGVAYLLEHLPRHIHVAIATRTDPGFPLARLRAAGELTEIRAVDLRFTQDEAAAYLNGSMGLGLAGPDVAALEARTEGWIAALQLAALSMQGRGDARDFIANFAGGARYVVDYLVEEVLHVQPEPVRRFLLQTSVLTRLTGSSTDAVTGETGGKAMLELLDRKNLFVVALDGQRQEYRYHHLFADVLLARLEDEHPDLVPELHRRASAWYGEHDEVSEAIRHAILAEDFDRAASLIEQAMPAIRSSRRDGAMLGWLRALPKHLIASRPVLSVHYAGALIDRGQIGGAEALLEDAERWLESTTDQRARPGERVASPIVTDDAEFRRLPGSIAIYRAALAHLRGDAISTVSHANQALDLVNPDDHLSLGSAAGLLALSRWAAGDLEGAYGGWRDAMAHLEAAGHVTDAVGCLIAMADIRIDQGRLGDAMRSYERGLRLATIGGAPLRGTADMHVGMSERAYEWDRLDDAAQHLVTSKDLGEHLGLRQNPYRWRVAMARLRAAEGDQAGAIALLDDAERVYVSDFYPRVRPIAALRARIWIDQGRLAEARDWARSEGLSADGDLDYVRAFEHLTLARLMIAESRADQRGQILAAASALLDRLLPSALDGQRIGHVIEVLLMQALAHQLRGDIPAAHRLLVTALGLAEPEGYIRTFLDTGPPMAALFGSLPKPEASSYVRTVVAAFDVGEQPSGAPRSIGHGLIDPLSNRELEVLGLLRTDLDGPSIARHLVVSLSTIRSHTKAIYAKLGVSSRRAAIRRGEELGLLPPQPR
jgi:LuxR family transcriptional regulator, maltose regulon positive regulatory protein